MRTREELELKISYQSIFFHSLHGKPWSTIGNAVPPGDRGLITATWDEMSDRCALAVLYSDDFEHFSFKVLEIFILCIDAEYTQCLQWNETVGGGLTASAGNTVQPNSKTEQRVLFRLPKEKEKKKSEFSLPPISSKILWVLQVHINKMQIREKFYVTFQNQKEFGINYF